ncbi:high-affinity iron permease [Lecanora helva]
MAPNVFAVPIFFILFRETLETSIIVSVLLSWLKQTLGGPDDRLTYKKLRRQIWLGTAAGLFICLCIGAGFIGAFYTLGRDHWASTEDVWEGAFALFASIVITIMGAALLRVSKLQDKWRLKLAKALEAKDSASKAGPLGPRFKLLCEKYAMFILPFITVLREGLEAVIFVGGVSVGSPATAFPLPVVTGFACGCLIGYFIYKGGSLASIQIFLIVSTCFLYLVAAGLFSKSVWYFENYKWGQVIGGDASETGSGPGSYDIRQSVWHVNCCNPEIGGGGGWGIFNALFGWQNSATYGSVIAYNLYWVVVIIAFLAMRRNERQGHWSLMKKTTPPEKIDPSSSDEEADVDSTKKDTEGSNVMTKIRSKGSATPS